MIKIIFFTFTLIAISTLNLQAKNNSLNSSNVEKLLNDAKSKTKSISVKKFYDLIDNDDEDFIQLDIREDNQQGHGEIWSIDKVKLTRGYIEYKIEHLIKNKKAKVIIVCCSGSRSLFAAETLQDLGYTNVYYLEGGIRGWLYDGYPLDTVFGELYYRK